MASFWRREIHPCMQYKLLVYRQPRQVTMVQRTTFILVVKREMTLAIFNSVSLHSAGILPMNSWLSQVAQLRCFNSALMY